MLTLFDNYKFIIRRIKKNEDYEKLKKMPK